MTEPEFREKLDKVQAAMERVRSGESEVEEVEVPSGGRVRLTRDDEAPTGVRVEMADGEEESKQPREPDPDRKAAAERINTAMERMKTGESDEEEILLTGGETMRVVKDPEIPGAFIMESGREGNQFRAWTLQEPREKPASYPGDLPFLANTSVSISTITSGGGKDSSRTVTWMKPPDVNDALASLRAQLQEDGWVEGEKSVASTLHGPSTGYTFTRGGRTRQVMVMAFGPMSQIMMMEKESQGS